MMRRKELQHTMQRRIDGQAAEISRLSVEANSHYRDNGSLCRQVDRIPVVEAKAVRLATKVVELEKALEEAHTQRKTLEKELRVWRTFWGWVRVHSRPGTPKWLRRLWEKGPKPAPDNAGAKDSRNFRCRGSKGCCMGGVSWKTQQKQHNSKTRPQTKQNKNKRKKKKNTKKKNKKKRKNNNNKKKKKKIKEKKKKEKK